MTDVAYQLLSKKKNSVTFNKLWDEVSQIMGYSENVAERKIASFYTSMMLDNRFTSLGNNKWDLRSRHTYNETHFDTSAIVLEDDITTSWTNWTASRKRRKWKKFRLKKQTKKASDGERAAQSAFSFGESQV